MFFRPLTLDQAGAVQRAVSYTSPAGTRTRIANGYNIVLRSPVREGSPTAKAGTAAVVFSREEQTEPVTLFRSGFGSSVDGDTAALDYQGLALQKGSLDRIATILALATGADPIEVAVYKGTAT